jgi:hypothetical protein
MDATAKGAFMGFRKYFDAHDLDPDLARHGDGTHRGVLSAALNLWRRRA